MYNILVKLNPWAIQTFDARAIGISQNELLNKSYDYKLIKKVEADGLQQIAKPEIMLVANS
ncbi:MAG: hypothetical protein IPO27_09150 [Bacteroidetes bacterium]|nr:hypothetical protein [Bacteroidota bacterium]